MNPSYTLGDIPDKKWANPPKVLMDWAITYFWSGLAPSSKTV